jgi:hypothetical protein
MHEVWQMGLPKEHALSVLINEVREDKPMSADSFPYNLDGWRKAVGSR